MKGRNLISFSRAVKARPTDGTVTNVCTANNGRTSSSVRTRGAATGVDNSNGGPQCSRSRSPYAAKYTQERTIETTKRKHEPSSKKTLGAL